MRKNKRYSMYSGNNEASLIRQGIYLGYSDQFNPISPNRYQCKNKEVEKYLKFALDNANSWLVKEPIVEYYCPYSKQKISFVRGQYKICNNICTRINQIRLRTWDFSPIKIIK